MSATRPRLLDLYSCAGGAAMGYHRAGFDVVGVDHKPQPNYPFEHHVADALEFLAEHGHEFDAVHASPPCQDSSALTKGNRGREGWRDDHVDLIGPTREAFSRLTVPTVIENVQGSKLRRDLVLCGDMFGLDVIRHRYFELTGFFAMHLCHGTHRGRVAGLRHSEWFEGPYFAVYGEGGGKGTVEQWQQAMGINWTNDRRELAEAIPPAYTEFIGEALMTELEARAVA